jgi:DNA-binding CsgD family transcriptional regulator
MDQMTRIEWKLDQVLAALAVRNVDAIVEAPAEQAAADPPERSEGQDQGDDGRVDLLARLTTKQHATFQMLLGGASNKDIAARFGVTENTAKVYVRSIAAKVKVKTRSEIVMRLWSAFRNVDDESYRMMSGGLPKEWNQKFEYPDQFADLYRKDTDGPETDA